MADGKWIEGLTPEMTVCAAAQEVLVTRFQVVRHYLPLAVENSAGDPEFVHQLRVGTRRVGAALRVFADCLPRKHLKEARQTLQIIRRAAGDARDWDVFLLGLPNSKSLSGTAGKPTLDFLLGYALGERTAAQVRLKDASAEVSDRLFKESNNLPGLVHEPKGETTFVNFGELASDQLGNLLSGLITAVEANPSSPVDLHQLRIQGKRVRYALEVFADCFPPIFRESVYPTVERLQELLGDVQDATVGLSRLITLRERIKQLLPGEWARLRTGFDGLTRTMRAKIPAGRKAFQKWQVEWLELVAGLKMETALLSVTA